MVKKRTILSLIIMFLICIIIQLFSFTVPINKFIAILTLFFSLIWVYKCWNNIYLLIISLFILYCNYSVVVGIYLDESLRPIYLYPQINSVEVYGIGIFILFSFSMGLALLTPKIKTKAKTYRNILINKNNDNKFIFYLLLLVFNLITIFGFTRIANSRGSSSPIYEYNAIILLLLFYYSADRSLRRFFCIECIMVYSLSSLIGGSRVEVLICLIIFALCYFKKSINQKVLCTGMCMGLCLFSFIGTIRGNWAALVTDKSQILSLVIKDKFVFDTCTYAYFPMVCMIELFQNFSFSSSLYYFIRFLGTIFLGQSRVVDGDLIWITGEHYFHNYGGFTLGFFYVWFSYFGGLLFSLYVYFYEKIMMKISKSITEFKVYCITYFVATVPRWYLYGPWSMTRGLLVCSILFIAMSYLSKICSKRGRL